MHCFCCYFLITIVKFSQIILIFPQDDDNAFQPNEEVRKRVEDQHGTSREDRNIECESLSTK